MVTFLSRRISLLFRFAILVAFAVAGACAKDGERTRMSDGGRRADFVNPTAQIQGRWKSGCLDPKETGFGEIATFQIDGARFERRLQVSPHGDCTKPFIEGRIAGQMIFRPESRQIGTAVDLEADSASLKPLTPLAVKVLNLAKTCGISNWKVGEERDVIEKLGQVGCVSRYPKIDYNLMAVEKTIEKQHLYFGAGERLNKPALRPVQLDRSDVVYTWDGF